MDLNQGSPNSIRIRGWGRGSQAHLFPVVLLLHVYICVQIKFDENRADVSGFSFMTVHFKMKKTPGKAVDRIYSLK